MHPRLWVLRVEQASGKSVNERCSQELFKKKKSSSGWRSVHVNRHALSEEFFSNSCFLLKYWWYIIVLFLNSTLWIKLFLGFMVTWETHGSSGRVDILGVNFLVHFADGGSTTLPLYLFLKATVLRYNWHIVNFVYLKGTVELIIPCALTKALPQSGLQTLLPRVSWCLCKASFTEGLF